MNMLQMWYTPLATNCWAEKVDDGEMERDELLVWCASETSTEQPMIGDHLDKTQQQELQGWVIEYHKVFRSHKTYGTLYTPQIKQTH